MPNNSTTSSDKGAKNSESLIFDWDEANRVESLQRYYEQAVTKIKHRRDWYVTNSAKKKKYAQWLRVIALILLGIGGVLPVIIDMANSSLPPSWATLIIAAGTGLLGLDRYLGYSTAWMRFRSTELLLGSKLETLQADWESERVRWAENSPTSEEAAAMILMCNKVIQEVEQTVQDETQLWIDEFQNNIKMLDDKFTSLAERTATGALILKVENGSSFEKGWELLLDENRTPMSYVGKTAALPSLAPGIHSLKVTPKFTDGEAGFSEETVVTITPGQITSVSITLPSAES